MPEDFIARQLQFTANLREPGRYPVPQDVSSEGMKLYQDLVFLNIQRILSKGFPVLKSTQSDHDWNQLIRDFIAKHKSKRPTTYEVPEEFLHYLSYVRRRETDPAWMYELAHYEWLELALDLSPLCLSEVPHNYAGNLLNDVPVISPLAWIHVYQYPVHTITATYQPLEPTVEPTYLIVYRNWRDKVEFMRINDFTYALLGLLSRNTACLSGREVLDSLISHTNHPNPAMVIQGGSLLLEELRERHIILGTKS